MSRVDTVSYAGQFDEETRNERVLVRYQAIEEGDG